MGNNNNNMMVRCPMCLTVLQAPENAAMFQCPCGAVLQQQNLPTVLKQGQTAPGSGTVGCPGQSCARASDQDVFKTAVKDLVGEIQRFGHSMGQSVMALAGKEDLAMKQLTALNEIPPEEMPDSASETCQVCHTDFTFIRRRHHCRNCGQLVCGSCSRINWPANMLPPRFNKRNEKTMRICTQCNGCLERFRGSLLRGDVQGAQNEYATGTVRLSCPYSIYLHSMYPIHIAASSGSIACVEWLISLGCLPELKDSRGYTALAIAANKEHMDLVTFMIRNNRSKVGEITDVRALQQCLQKAIMNNSPPLLPAPAPAPLPSAPPPPSYSQVTSSSTAPVPRNETEENEQMKIAIAASRVDGESLSAANEDIQEAIPVEDAIPTGPAANDCIICFDAPIDTVFTPCGHTCCCSNCAQQFANKECPVCRQNITQVIKTYHLSA